MKTTKLRQLARGQECKVRIPAYCNSDPATTVLAHLNGGGWSRKVIDIHGAHCCSACHDVVDGRIDTKYQPLAVAKWFNDGVLRTQQWLYDNGYLTWDGDSPTRKDAEAENRLISMITKLK